MFKHGQYKSNVANIRFIVAILEPSNPFKLKPLIYNLY